MCWMSKVEPVRMVAESDIKVYKVLSKRKGHIESPIYNEFRWKVGEVRKCDSEIVVSFNRFYWLIRKGFHSVRSCPVVEGYKWRSSDSGEALFMLDSCDYVYECVIPAGSVYYENEWGDVVSDALIVLTYCSTYRRRISRKRRLSLRL